MAMNKDNDDVAGDGDNGDDNNDDGMYKDELNRKSLLGSLF